MHLVEPADRVPEGVTVEIKHFLSFPRDLEVKDYMEGNGHWHDIVKVTMEDDMIDLETIGQAQPGLTEEDMFSTTKFQGKRFCQVSATGNYTCKHSALKVITVTRNSKSCPHKDKSLSLYCFSDSTAKDATPIDDIKHGKEKYETDLRKRSLITTNVSVDLVTVKTNQMYNIWLSANETFSGDPFKISHELICMYNGVKSFGTVMNVQCGCCKSNHCNNFKEIHIKVKAAVIEANDEPEEYNVFSLECIPVQQALPINNAGKTWP